MANLFAIIKFFFSIIKTPIFFLGFYIVNLIFMLPSLLSVTGHEMRKIMSIVASAKVDKLERQ